RVAQRVKQRLQTRLLNGAHPVGQVAYLHGAGVRDALARDLRRARALVETRSAALWAGLERYDALDERPDVRLHGFWVLVEHRLLELGYQPLVRQVDALDLDLGGLLVKQVV